MANSERGWNIGNGLRIERVEDGSVRVIAEPSEDLRVVEMNADTWASVVSHVSAHGDHAPWYFQFLDFHNGKAGVIASNSPTVTA